MSASASLNGHPSETSTRNPFALRDEPGATDNRKWWEMHVSGYGKFYTLATETAVRASEAKFVKAWIASGKTLGSCMYSRLDISKCFMALPTTPR